MSSDIQFGELEHAEPQKEIRPDRNAHYSVMPVGGIGMPDANGDPTDDLLIFVDLDVMRDMEAHADSDTNVELGGVMLGFQRFDDNGRPFVVITDCLRAEHYHATKGSFKFTHDTWSQITEKRKQLHPNLEMVGWYHTHPGWTVFLSGMDLFICNNFFNKPLDVALVIDPVNDDRGWFQWTDDSRPVTRPTQGFYLMTNKYRQSELKYFSRLYSKGLDMNDPRYSESSFGSGASPVVNVMDNRRPLFDLAIVAMLTFQFLVLSLLAWKLLAPTPEVATEQTKTLSTLDDARNEAYRDILKAAVSASGEEPSLVDKYSELKTENARLVSNLDGQIVRAEKYSDDLEAATSSLNVRSDQLKKMDEQLTLAKSHNDEMVEKLATFEKSQQDGETEGEDNKTGNYWWWLIAGGTLALGAGLGIPYGIRRGRNSTLDEFGYGPSNEKELDTPNDEERIRLSVAENEKRTS